MTRRHVCDRLRARALVHDRRLDQIERDVVTGKLTLEP